MQRMQESAVAAEISVLCDCHTLAGILGILGQVQGCVLGEAPGSNGSTPVVEVQMVMLAEDLHDHAQHATPRVINERGTAFAVVARSGNKVWTAARSLVRPPPTDLPSMYNLHV